MRRLRPWTHRFWSIAAAFVSVAVTAPMMATLAGEASQAPQPFRATVDLIAVDVQVVDRLGRPIPRLPSNRFQVAIDGHKRRVVSVDFLEQADPNAPKRRVIGADPGDRPAAPARVYVIGVDVSSFNAAESRAIIEGARAFIAGLQPHDSVGLYAFPVGPKFRPSTDHAAIVRRLETIRGSREALHNGHGLSAMDVIDIMAETAKADTTPIMMSEPTGRGNQQAQGTNSETLDAIVSRECGAEDRPCAQAILAEAQGMSFILQGQATETLQGLRQLVQALGTIDGRKTLVLLSAGVPASDRPGGRPDVGELPKLLGQDAAGSNTTIYSLFVETAFSQWMSVKARQANRSFGDGREREVFGRVLEEFTDASGGALLPVAQGTGVGQFERVLLETSSRYLLGVEPTPADRDGKPHRLRVKVDKLPRGSSIRSRLWVVVPQSR